MINVIYPEHQTSGALEIKYSYVVYETGHCNSAQEFFYNFVKQFARQIHPSNYLSIYLSMNRFVSI
jgi:hypothetical protein